MLHRATELDSVEFIHALLNAGADVNAKTTKGQTSLHIAITDQNAHLEIVNALVVHGADPTCAFEVRLKVDFNLECVTLFDGYACAGWNLHRRSKENLG